MNAIPTSDPENTDNCRKQHDQALLPGPVRSWRIFFGCRRPKVGSMLPLAVLDQRKSTLVREDRPLAPASRQDRWRAGDSNMTSFSFAWRTNKFKYFSTLDDNEKQDKK
jgi:hypothetical protein